MFFFSSRRRHTRLQGDWSSDVCSSDLPPESTKELSVPASPTVNAVILDSVLTGPVISKRFWDAPCCSPMINCPGLRRPPEVTKISLPVVLCPNVNPLARKSAQSVTVTALCELERVPTTMSPAVHRAPGPQSSTRLK